MKPRLLLACRLAAALMAVAAPVSSQAPVAPSRQAVIDELVVANHTLANEGVVDGAMQLGGGKMTYLDPEETKLAAPTYERSWDFWKSRLPCK